MSLVTDALKKARHDAAAREAKEKGLPEPLPLPSSPFRPARPRPSAAFIVSPILAVAILLGIYLSVKDQKRSSGRETTQESSSPATASIPAAIVTPAAVATAVRNAPAASTNASPSSSASAAPSERPADASRLQAGSATSPAKTVSLPGAFLTSAPTATTAAPQETKAPPPAATPPTTTASPVSPPTAIAAEPKAATLRAATASATQTFRRRVDLGDGRAIELGGIAFSESAPFAYLNGKLLGVGEIVENWTVRKIDRDRVTLNDGTTTIVLTLR